MLNCNKDEILKKYQTPAFYLACYVILVKVSEAVPRLVQGTLLPSFPGSHPRTAGTLLERG